MARIRSIKPGFWTDESIVQVSIPARLLLIGLGNEADDTGSFQWKALTLKMRLFPVDSVDVEALLGELVKVDLVRQYEVNGSKYGVIRNFRKHQSPRRPSHEHPIPDELRQYAGLTDKADTTEAVKDTPGSQVSGTHDVKGDQFPTNAGTDPVKDASVSPGEERRGGEGSKKKELRRKKISYSEDFESFWKAFMKDERAVRGQSKEDAFIEWKKLSEEDRAQALAAIKPYQDECRKADQQLKHVERYLKKGVFRNYAVVEASNILSIKPDHPKYEELWVARCKRWTADGRPGKPFRASNGEFVLPEGCTPPEELTQ